MKLHSSRGVAAVVLAAVLSLQVAPIALAMPRDERGDVGTKLVRVMKALQRLFSLVPNDDAPVPPKP